ncbi:MAG: TRAP transporter substrate-binding protein [Alphaproteobacteria bacterium]
MLKDLRQHVLTAALAAMAVGGPAATAAAEELSIAHFMAPQHVMHRALMAPLAEEVAAATGGALTMRIYPGGELGAGPQQQYMRAVEGVADVAFGLQGYTSPQFPRTLLVELPGLADDPVEATAMLWNAFDDHLADEYRGVHVLGIWTNEPNILMTRDRPIRSLDDLAGMKIRVPGAVMGRTVEALGATPVAMPAPRMYNALNTGIVDGLLVGPCVIPAFKIGEVANHFTVGLPLGVAAFFLVMNEASWDGLSDDDRVVLDRLTGREMSLEAAASYGDCGARAVESMRADPNKEVIELPADEVARFEDILNVVREDVLNDAEASGVPARATIDAMKAGG